MDVLLTNTGECAGSERAQLQDQVLLARELGVEGMIQTLLSTPSVVAWRKVRCHTWAHRRKLSGQSSLRADGGNGRTGGRFASYCMRS